MVAFRAHQNTINGTESNAVAEKTVDPMPGIGVFDLRKDIRFIHLFTLVLVAGFSFGFIETFNYPAIRQFYKTTGNEAVLGRDMMLGRICFSFAGITMYYNSGKILSALGHTAVLHGAMVGLISCYLLYGHVDGPAMTSQARLCYLLGEACRGATFAMFMTTALGYAHKISPPSLKATVLQLVEATYRGLGFMSGGILGGQFIAASPSTAYAFEKAGLISLSLFLVATTTSLWFGRGQQRFRVNTAAKSAA